MATTFPPPRPTFIGPAAHTSAGTNRPVQRIVIHSTVSPTVEGGARAVARYFQSESSGGSAHYVVDPGEVIQCVGDSVIAWHAPPNPRSLGIELCEYPTTNLRRFFRRGVVPVGTHRGDLNVFRWMRKPYRRMLRRAARLTAELCLAYDVPPRYVTAAGLKAGKRGVTTHAQVSRAFGQSSHWDPGAWPRRLFMRTVRRQVALIREESKS